MSDEPAIPAPGGPFSKRDLIQIVVLFAVVAVLTVTWRLTPLGQQLNPERLAEWAGPWRDDPFALLYVVGAVGWGMRVLGVPLVPAVLGLILGPLAEQQFRRALAISQGDYTVFLTRPISATLLACRRRS